VAELTGAVWRKSSRSGGSGGNCVEVADNLASNTGSVYVRDSKDPAGPVLAVSAAGWTSFIAALRAGTFDGEA
jgi:hypothetical protein